MILKFEEDRVKCIERVLDLSLKELVLYDWSAKLLVDVPKEENNLSENDKVKLFMDGIVIAVNKNWVDASESEYEICSEIWYYVRKMFQYLQVRRFEMKAPRAVHGYIIEQWEKIIRSDGYEDTGNDITDITEIDAYTFMYYMLAKYFNVNKSDLPNAIVDDIVAKLAEEYDTYFE